MSLLAGARDAVRSQIAERDSFFPGTGPQFPWNRCAKAMSYVLSLPEDDLRSIRLHCDTFLGASTPQMLFMDISPGHDALISDYRWLGEGIDPHLWASEPVVAVLDRPLGVEADGKFINQITLDLQRYLCNLIRLGLQDGQHIVEIGAGYGGLAEAVLRARNVRYTIIDLPETLVFSAAFLIHHFPEKRVYIYRPGDTPDMMEGADLVFLPNYRADWVQPMDIAINTVSFPEMNRDALIDYIDLIADRLLPDGFLMSVNYHGDRGDGLGIPDFLARRFMLHPPVSEKAQDPHYYHIAHRPTFVCTRAGDTVPPIELREVIMAERIVVPLSACAELLQSPPPEVLHAE